MQMVSGQNLNFAIPITYVSPLIVNAPAKPFPNIPRATTARAARLKQPSSPSTDQPPAQPALSSRPGAGDVQQILKVPLAIKLDLSDLTSDDNAAPKSELDSVQALYDQKKYDEAKASFNTVSDNTKTTFDGQLLLCKIEQQRKEYREAVSACETAIKARPSAVTPTELKRLLC